MGRRSKFNRLVREREPNGRAVRVQDAAPGEVRRLRDAALAGMRDPEWATPAGQLFLQGKLSSEHYATAKWWSTLAADYNAALCGPRGARTVNLDAAGGEPPDPDSEAGAALSEKERDINMAFGEAISTLSCAGKSAQSMVRAVCEHNYYPSGPDERQALNAGLAILCSHRRLTNQRKSGVK